MSIGAILFPFEPFNFSTKPTESMTDAQARLVREFNHNITSNRVVLEEVPCLCGGKDFELIASVDRYGILQRTVLCINCGLIQSNPRMTMAQYKDFYSSDLYRRCYEGDDYLAIDSRKYSDGSVQHIFEAIDKIKKIGPGTTVLELGAAGGWNLVPFMKAGAKACGIEYSSSLVGLGREHGIEMAQGDIDDIAGKYDVIVLNHVLEHMTDPVGILRRITSHMNEGALIYIGVPNIMNFGITQLQNAHTYYFTPWTLKHFCSRAGLELLSKGPAQKVHMFGIFKKGMPTDSGDPKRHYTLMRSHLGNFSLKCRIKSILSRILPKNAGS